MSKKILLLTLLLWVGVASPVAHASKAATSASKQTGPGRHLMEESAGAAPTFPFYTTSAPTPHSQSLDASGTHADATSAPSPTSPGSSGTPYAIGGLCHSGVLSAASCGNLNYQASYFITELSPIFCPAGYTFAPLGVTVVGSSFCPVTFPASMTASPEHCKSGPVPTSCSNQSKTVASIPGLCGAHQYSIVMGVDGNGCPNVPSTYTGGPSGSYPQGSASPFYSQSPPSYETSQPYDAYGIRLSFATSHLCNYPAVTRDCLLSNTSFQSEILSQCSRLPTSATSATRAVCSLLLGASTSTLAPMIDSLATLLSRDLSPFSVCFESYKPTAPAMKKLLIAISNTESRDPRDPTAIATILLNLCHSSCRDSSTATLVAMAADYVRLTRSGPRVFVHSFCTNPLIGLLWQHANKSPRECSDSMITFVGSTHAIMASPPNFLGMTTCALRAMLPVYVAMCDAKAVECEDTLLSMPPAETQACDQTLEANAACSADCAAFVGKISSGSKCAESIFSIQEVVAHATQQTCADSASIVKAYSTRSSWRKNAPILNSKCNLTSPIPLDLGDAKALYDNGWSSRIVAKQPAAFHVPQDDIRVVLKEITHGSTLMLYASYSVVMNMSDFSLFAANPSAQAFGNPNENIMNNITNAITDGLKHMLPARHGSVFSISLDFQAEQRVTSHFSEMVMEGSVVLLALNSSEPNTYIGWSDLAVVAFQSKLPPAIQARNIISPQNFKVNLLPHYGVQKIPPMSQNAAASFEFSAVPTLLQRLPAPSLLDSSLYTSTMSALSELGFPRPKAFSQNSTMWKACSVHSVGPLSSGTLYAGDGVVVQQPEDIDMDPNLHGCIATLRYPRSTFPSSGHVSFFWARQEAPTTSARKSRKPYYQSSDIFQPDAQLVSSLQNTEYGRINLQFLSNGSVVHNIAAAQGSVSESEVVLNIRLSYVDVLTLYAVRRFKIESYETAATTRLTPMQPRSQRSVASGPPAYADKPKPIDFSCTELDLSALPNGARVMLSVISPGGDVNSSVMVYFYPDSADLYTPAPSSPSVCTTSGSPHAMCNEYFVQGLYRQHTNSGAFHNFSAAQGRAFLVNNPGYYVACVAASAKDAGSTLQDGATMLNIQRKSLRDSRQCAQQPYSANQPNTGNQNIQPTTWCYPAVFKASDCTSNQSLYFIEKLSSLFCPPGYTFTPFGVEGLCPRALLPISMPPQLCKTAPAGGMGAPSSCSYSSVMMSLTPDLCAPGSYPGMLGFDAYGCPITQSNGHYATAPYPHPATSVGGSHPGTTGI